MHARDRRSRARIIDALSETEDHQACRLAERINGCCACPMILVSPSGDVRLSLQRCRCRMCPTCARARSIDAAARVTQLVREMNAPRMLTLTLKSTDTPLADQIDRLLDSARTLRRSKSWGNHVLGGVSTIEVTRDAETGRWHPHLHLLVDGTYYPQPQLKADWLKVTGDSYVVDVRKVHDATQAGRYVAAYMCKHGQVSSWPNAAIREFADAMHGRRMVQTFGQSHGVECDAKPRDEQPADLEPVASIRELDDLANTGDATAQAARTHAHRLGYPWNIIWPGHTIDQATITTTAEDEIKAMIAMAALEVRAKSMAPIKPTTAPRAPPRQPQLLPTGDHSGRQWKL